MITKDARTISHNLGYRAKFANGPLKVILVVITVWSFFFSSIGIDTNAWAAKTPGELTSVGSDRGDGLGLSGEVHKEINPDTLTVPDYLGTIRDAWTPGKYALASPKDILAKPPQKMVIHIQDAHCNYEGQHKISEILAYVNKEYGVKSVNLEGGAKSYNLSPLTSITEAEIRQRVTDYFVKNGRVNGAEYFAVNNPGKINLWGVEDTQLYVANLGVYRASLQYKREVDKYLSSLSYILTNLKIKIYNKELLEFDAKYIQYKAGNLEFKDYLSYILAKAKEKGFDIKDFASLHMLSKALDEEPGIDFGKANSERDQFVERLQKKLSNRTLEELIAKTGDFKSGRVSQKDFYDYLAEKAKVVNVDPEGYKELKKYIDYVSTYSSVDKMKVMGEIAELESKLKETMYENQTQRKLDLLSKNLVLLKNIFNISLSKDDYKYFVANKASFDMGNYVNFIEKEAPSHRIATKLEDGISKVDAYRDDIAKFYEYSLKRDEVFLKNMKYDKISGKTSDGKEVAIMITGGFHTENLAEHFRRNNIAYVSIMPNFRNNEGYKAPYMDLLAGQETQVEKAIDAALSSMQIYDYLTELGIAVDGERGMRRWLLSVDIITALERGQDYIIQTPLERIRFYKDKETGEVKYAVERRKKDDLGPYDAVVNNMDDIGPLLYETHQDVIDKQLTEAYKNGRTARAAVDDVESVAEFFANKDGLNRPDIADMLLTLHSEGRVNIIKGVKGFKGHAGAQGIHISEDADIRATIAHEAMAYFYDLGHDVNDRIEQAYLAYAANPKNPRYPIGASPESLRVDLADARPSPVAKRTEEERTRLGRDFAAPDDKRGAETEIAFEKILDLNNDNETLARFIIRLRTVNMTYEKIAGFNEFAKKAKTFPGSLSEKKLEALKDILEMADTKTMELIRRYRSVYANGLFSALNTIRSSGPYRNGGPQSVSMLYDNIINSTLDHFGLSDKVMAIAFGSYGRDNVPIGSDCDVMFLVNDDVDPATIDLPLEKLIWILNQIGLQIDPGSLLPKGTLVTWMTVDDISKLYLTPYGWSLFENNDSVEANKNPTQVLNPIAHKAKPLTFLIDGRIISKSGKVNGSYDKFLKLREWLLYSMRESNRSLLNSNVLELAGLMRLSVYLERYYRDTDRKDKTADQIKDELIRSLESGLEPRLIERITKELSERFNIKHDYGGTRTIDIIVWLGQVLSGRPITAAARTQQESIHALPDNYLSPTDKQRLENALAFFIKLRSTVNGRRLELSKNGQEVPITQDIIDLRGIETADFAMATDGSAAGNTMEIAKMFYDAGDVADIVRDLSGKERRFGAGQSYRINADLVKTLKNDVAFHRREVMDIALKVIRDNLIRQLRSGMMDIKEDFPVLLGWDDLKADSDASREALHKLVEMVGGQLDLVAIASEDRTTTDTNSYPDLTASVPIRETTRTSQYLEAQALTKALMETDTSGLEIGARTGEITVTLEGNTFVVKVARDNSIGQPYTIDVDGTLRIKPSSMDAYKKTGHAPIRSLALRGIADVIGRQAGYSPYSIYTAGLVTSTAAFAEVKSPEIVMEALNNIWKAGQTPDMAEKGKAALNPEVTAYLAALDEKGKVSAETAGILSEAGPIYDAVASAVPIILDTVNRDATTYLVSPAPVADYAKTVEWANKLRQALGRKGAFVQAGYYKIGMGEDWMKGLESEFKKVFDGFLDKILKERQNTARLCIRVPDNAGRNSIMQLITSNARFQGLSDNEQKLVMARIKIENIEIIDAVHLNPVPDLFTDMLAMEFDRFEQNDYLKSAMPENLPVQLGRMLQLTTSNITPEMTDKDNLANTLKNIFDGLSSLVIRPIDWKSIDEWRDRNNAVAIAA